MSLTEPEWSLRTFQLGDERGIVDLFERGYSLHLEERDWQWKFNQRAPAEDNVWVAVDVENRPVFHYGGCPRRLALPGRTLDSMVTFDGVTDPDFRRRGIFTAAMTEAHEHWANAGIACVLGLPNEEWGSRVQALDWRPLFPLRWQVRLLRPEHALAKRLHLPAIGKLTSLGRLSTWFWDPRPDPTIEVREARRAEGNIESLWEDCRQDGRIGFVRDRDWLDWRYFSHPRHRYRMLIAHRGDGVAGYLIYRFDREVRYGYIAELLTRPADMSARAALLRTVLDRFEDYGALGAAALAVPGGGLQRSLKRAGFLLSWGAFTVRCVPLVADLPFESLLNPRCWSIHGGDFDVI
jgi:ribosomal protein S18 acetylase RimI-like enzyme